MNNDSNINKLAATLKTNNDKLFAKYFKKWLVAAVACALEPGVTNHTCLVLVGNQGIGKTRWLEALCPPKLKEYLFSGTINPNDKDTVIHLSECFLIHLDELENLNKTEIGTLKEIITKNTIRIRRPYAYHAEKQIRRASFMGSVNASQFLNDPSGSRRFLCFTVENIKLRYDVLIDDVWAEAYSLYKAGFRHWFDKNEIDEINSLNEPYQNLPLEEELLLKYFEPVSPDDASLFLSASEILVKIKDKVSISFSHSSDMKLGKALKKRGFLRVKKDGLYKWAVNEILFEAGDNYSGKVGKVINIL